jgi:hypothetical protein
MASAAPITTSEMSDEEFEQKTLDVIAREFGPGGLVRFLMAFRSGHGDYTAERHERLDHLTIEDILRDMAAQGLPQNSDPS